MEQTFEIVARGANEGCDSPCAIVLDTCKNGFNVNSLRRQRNIFPPFLSHFESFVQSKVVSGLLFPNFSFAKCATWRPLLPLQLQPVHSIAYINSRAAAAAARDAQIAKTVLAAAVQST